MKKTEKGVVWQDPRAEQSMLETMEINDDAHFKISRNLADKISKIIGHHYNDQLIIAKLIHDSIEDQIRQYLREYDNEVALDIVRSLKGEWALGDIKKWSAEVDWDNARHAKLFSFGSEIEEHIKKLQDESALHRVKERVLRMNPEPDSTTDNNDGKVWISNVLTIIDEELNPRKQESPNESEG